MKEQKYTCEVCDGTDVDMFSKQLCPKHENLYFDCVLIVGKGDQCQREGNFLQAIKHYCYALEILPTYTLAWFQLTLLFIRRYKYAGALG